MFTEQEIAYLREQPLARLATINEDGQPDVVPLAFEYDGTHFWVDRKEKLIAVAMTQTSNQEFLRDFENMVMQSVVGGGSPRGIGTN